MAIWKSIFYHIILHFEGGKHPGEMKTTVIGITGGICSGKSTVASLFRKKGIPVLDADEVTHNVYLPGTRAYELLVDRFGDSILNELREIDRKKLGNIVFSDPVARKFLEGVTHPAIEGEMRKFVTECSQKGHRLCAIEAALIFEKGKSKLFDKILTVYVDEKTQLERLIKRDKIEVNEALARIRSQMPLAEKARLADYVIDNSGPLAQTEKQVEKIISALTGGS